MLTCIGFIVYLASAKPAESVIIGEFKSETACMSAGEKWANEHAKLDIEATFSCERDKREGVEI